MSVAFHRYGSQTNLARVSIVSMLMFAIELNPILKHYCKFHKILMLI